MSISWKVINKGGGKSNAALSENWSCLRMVEEQVLWGVAVGWGLSQREGNFDQRYETKH